MDALLTTLGDEVADAEDETFLLYSRLSRHSAESSGNLGFIDPKADELEIHVAGKDLTIRQFPNLLVSTRAEGTTGAVLWRITPPFADSFASRDSNPLFSHGILGAHSKVVELGCGVAGVVLLAVAPLVGEYIATDQQYILQHLYRNIEANAHVLQPKKRNHARGNRKSAEKDSSSSSVSTKWNIKKLDWETDSIVGLPEIKDASVVIAVDCIYNEALIEPFVRTCADICRFRSSENSPPTLCVICQQLRSEDVFGAFMRSFIQTFRVWQVSESFLNHEMRNNPGFVVHIGILRTNGDSYVANQVYPNDMLQNLQSR